MGAPCTGVLELHHRSDPLRVHAASHITVHGARRRRRTLAEASSATAATARRPLSTLVTTSWSRVHGERSKEACWRSTSNSSETHSSTTGHADHCCGEVRNGGPITCSVLLLVPGAARGSPTLASLGQGSLSAPSASAAAASPTPSAGPDGLVLRHGAWPRPSLTRSCGAACPCSLLHAELHGCHSSGRSAANRGRCSLTLRWLSGTRALQCCLTNCCAGRGAGLRLSSRACPRATEISAGLRVDVDGRYGPGSQQVVQRCRPSQSGEEG
mmetsp:Transcript_57647/g.134265  ORF Transcript_57647/g.134265 Transcript_57647/m.134265 type:complete len:270 (-) Transcript_57647:842-1651(-)